MHCQLELATGLQFLACDGAHVEDQAAHNDSAGCSDDTCAQIESGFYKLEEDQPSVAGPGLLPIFLAAALSGFAPAPNSSFKSVLLPDPPDPPQPWHLFAGCAAPPRAPTAA